MVDLAGSEKVSKSKVSGEGLEEAKKINLSLSCLGNTINALSKGQEHIPFRDSKLTRVLQESLSGNSLTRVIVTCSMHASCQEETLSSLKFAHRVKKIKTGAIQNIQFRSSEQSINRVMYQTLKSSFKNYEEKIQQIK
jgi:kinesin family protein 5